MVKLRFSSWFTTVVFSALVLAEGTVITRTNSSEHSPEHPSEHPSAHHAQVSAHGAAGHKDANASLAHAGAGQKKGRPLKDGHANMSQAIPVLKKTKKQGGANASVSHASPGLKKTQEEGHASLSQTGSGQKNGQPVQDAHVSLSQTGSEQNQQPLQDQDWSSLDYAALVTRPENATADAELRRRAPSTYATISQSRLSTESSWATRIETRHAHRDSQKSEVGSDVTVDAFAAADAPAAYSHATGIVSQAAYADNTERFVTAVASDTAKAASASTPSAATADQTDHAETLRTMVSETAPKEPVIRQSNVLTFLEIAFGKNNLLAFTFGLLLFTFMVVFLTACWGEVLKLSCRDKSSYVS